MMMGFGALGLLFVGAVVLALLGGGAALLSRQSAGTHNLFGTERPTPRQLLDERLAAGEISQEEYDSILARLER
jgi:uncharacterized membrane protein